MSRGACNRKFLPRVLTYGVGLLGFDANLLEDNALGVGRTTERAILHVSRPFVSLWFIRRSLRTWT
jgi:hypothetical protein